MEEGPENSIGGGVGERVKPKTRAKRQLDDLSRCRGRLPTGRRCEAARLRHSRYCVFHDPEMHERRRRLAEPIPYEHPDEVQRLLAEAVEAVKKGKLEAREGNTLGYLATLLAQNQARVEKEKERVNQAQYGAELAATVNEILRERAERREQLREEEEGG